MFGPQRAEAFVLEPDPFGFPSKESFISSYSFGPLIRVNDKVTPEFGFRPLFYTSRNRDSDSFQMQILYPFFSYRKNPLGYQAGILFNLISLGGNTNVQSAFPEKSFRIYPFIFYRRSENPERRQLAFAPFYGNFGDRIKFVLFPLYLKTGSREGISRNILWPVFAFYSGGRKGFRFWPFFGHMEEKKQNARFIMWPFYMEKTGNSGRIHRHYKAFFPFYYRLDFMTQSHKIYLWPFFQKSVDPARNLKSLHLPWPFVNFRTSDDGKRTRFFPLFESSETGVKKTGFFLWPLYSSSEIKFSGHEYRKKNFLIILKIRRENPFDVRKDPSLKVDLWPVFSYRRDETGSSYFHMISLFEPFMESSEKLYKNYSFLWRVFEVRRKKGVGTSVTALFGTLMFKKSCEESSFHLLGKALGYSSDLTGRKIRFLFLPVKIGGPSKRAEDCRG